MTWHKHPQRWIRNDVRYVRYTDTTRLFAVRKSRFSDGSEVWRPEARVDGRWEPLLHPSRTFRSAAAAKRAIRSFVRGGGVHSTLNSQPSTGF